MSEQELTPFTPEEIEKLRDELRSLNLKGTLDTLSEDSIEKLLLLPPSLFSEAVRSLAVALGPLPSFPAVEHPVPKAKRPNPIIDDGPSFLEDALMALTDYNKLLEEKIAKFNTQSVRSLAALRESSASDLDVSVLNEKIAEVKLRKSLHEKQIANLKDSIDSHDKKRYMNDEYSREFWKEVLSLNFFDEFFGRGHELASGTASTGLWDEYDYVLQHIERWGGLINDGSPESEATINQARQHVNQLSCSPMPPYNAAKSSRQKAVHDEAADIIKEIDWLWEEVIPVAHMSVSAQFLRPVLNHFKTWDDSKNFREAIVTTYASGVLRFMNDRLSAVAERTQVLVYHHQALHNVALARQLKETSKPIDTASGRPSHTLAQKAQPERGPTAASENLRGFMQIYGAVPIHANDPFPEPAPSLLDEYVQNRARKGDALLQDLHKHFETTAKSGLTDKELGLEMLLDSLLADSAATPAQLGSVYKDTQLEGSIAMLRDQANHIQEVFTNLKAEGPESAPDYVTHAYRQVADRLGRSRRGETSDPKLEDFIRKWGC
ncbi:hypothetical protein O1611_g1957 [Lasiodiplodia mahajangana]|uniref:Uncharacterized protein n=1 Tax=Lasiodiplodia mahajangana TaxID=1108764 RepID=A0ACC2JWM1_9PEZI|nr:hypothetical protein O1611_g1957 [Lasiodiplodia mahajangana]